MKIYYAFIIVLAAVEITLVVFAPVPWYTILASAVSWVAGVAIGYDYYSRQHVKRLEQLTAESRVVETHP